MLSLKPSAIIKPLPWQYGIAWVHTSKAIGIPKGGGAIELIAGRCCHDQVCINVHDNTGTFARTDDTAFPI